VRIQESIYCYVWETPPTNPLVLGRAEIFDPGWLGQAVYCVKRSEPHSRKLLLTNICRGMMPLHRLRFCYHYKSPCLRHSTPVNIEETGFCRSTIYDFEERRARFDPDHPLDPVCKARWAWCYNSIQVIYLHRSMVEIPYKICPYCTEPTTVVLSPTSLPRRRQAAARLLALIAVTDYVVLTRSTNCYFQLTC
jgi:hypothetical protein